MMTTARYIGSCFTLASLLEVSIYPSPGLVSPVDSGAHRDMNYFTFLVGSSVLAYYFTLFAEIGLESAREEPSKVFVRLRQVGQTAEMELLKATSGVNTQRGQLFSLGIAAGVSGICLARGLAVPSYSFYSIVREMCNGLSSRELASLNESNAVTKGEMLYLKHGYTGIRGEAEQGFPTVEHIGYPAFAHASQEGLSLNDSAVQALLSIMSKLNDTTVLGRAGTVGLQLLQQSAQQALNLGGVFSQAGRETIREMHKEFCAKRLSPGGAADLLALTMGLYFIENGFPSQEKLLTPSLFAR